MQILKQKKGSSTIYELLVALPILTFIIFFPITIFSYLRFQSSVEDVLNLGMQSMMVDGGLSNQTLDIINMNLESKGLPTTSDATNPTILVVSNSTNDFTKSSANIKVKTSHKTKYRDDIAIGTLTMKLYIPTNAYNGNIKTISKLINKINSNGTTLSIDGKYYVISMSGATELYYYSGG